MKEYRLAIDSAFVNPKTLRDLCSLGTVDAIVGPNGKVNINGVTLCFVSDSIPPNTEVEFHMSNWGIARIKSEVIKYKNDQLEKRAYEARIALLNKNISRQEANMFYDSLRFPVKFHVGIKEVLSGLSERSMGNGQKGNSVIHLILDEDFSNGRLKRKKNEFLCSNSKAKHYGDWSGTLGDSYLHMDGDGNQYTPKITCKQCLSVLDRYTIKLN